MNSTQERVLKEINDCLNIDYDLNSKLIIKQTPSYIKSKIETHDIITGVIAAFGKVISTLGKFRGLDSQTMTVDRRHSGMMLHSIWYQFQNKWQMDMSFITEPMHNFYLTKDKKWIFIQGAYPHHKKIALDYLDCANNKESLSKKISLYDSKKLEEIINKLGGCATILNNYETWMNHAQGKSIKNEPLIYLKKIGNAKPKIIKKGLRPLSNVRVIDFTRVVAGPNATRQLAEQGADVIHLRNPYLDHLLPIEIESSYGKRLCFADYKKAEQKTKIIELIKTCDVFVCGYRSDALKKFGLDFDSVIKINSNIIYLELNCYGHTGPWANRRGWEQLAQACSGLVVANSSEQEPHLVPALLNDYTTSYLGAIGVSAAILKMMQTGGAWNVKVSLTRTALMALQYNNNNEKIVPIGLKDYEEYLIDQESVLGLMTRVGPPIHFSKTPSYAIHSASFPGNQDLMKINWEWENIEKIIIKHRKTVITKNPEFINYQPESIEHSTKYL